MKILSWLMCSLSRRFALIAAIVLLGLGTAFAQAQTTPTQYFSQTGHNVTGEFLTFFNQHGGLRIFGYPLTEVFDYHGFKVQYFQKARMELHPENPSDYRIQLGLLGDDLGHGTSRLSATGNDLYRRYFPETGHTVAFAFLNFYDNNGGLDVFGYPIAEFTFENDHYVQYFQRAKMEWHPELSGDDRMQLADLGSIQFDVVHLPSSLKDPVAASIGSPTVTPAPISIEATASVLSPVIGRNGKQTLFVYVIDLDGAPVQGATVRYSVHDLGVDSISVGLTNQDGFVSTSFAVDGSKLGQQTVVEVKAVRGNAQATTQTSYVLWY